MHLIEGMKIHENIFIWLTSMVLCLAAIICVSNSFAQERPVFENSLFEQTDWATKDLNQTDKLHTPALADPEIRLYPNPVEDYLLIKSASISHIERVEFYNILGSKMLIVTVKPNGQLARLEVGDLPKGVYMIRVFDHANSVIYTKSISKN